MSGRGRVRVASAQYPITRVASVEAYCEKQQRLVAEAASTGAQLVVLPEYAPFELTAALAQEDQGSLAQQLAAVQALWPRAQAEHAALAKEHGVWLLAGTYLERVGDEVRNRAHLFGPHGEHCVQEKLQMTRFEREQLHVAPGDGGVVARTPIGVLGVAICYDTEFPLIVRRLVEAGAEIVLAPSCTDTLAGYHRVSLSCRARALENQCYVVQSVTVGQAPWSLALDENRGAAAVYGPVDRGFPDDGVIAAGTLDAPGWVTAELDLGALAGVRADGQVKNHEDFSRSRHLQGQVRTLDLTR